ncbi:MAG: hypothetical protein Q4G45_05660 [Actinomycetia bacterium]|nr:hypothetical protein [Actinomycetes bacterium]
MSVMLPPELSKFLGMIGFEWPEGDEDKIFDWAQRWTAYAGEVDTLVTSLRGARDGIAAENQGPALEAYTKAFSQENGVDDVTKNLAVAGNITGGCLMLIGAAVIALKIAFVVNLVSFAIQVASAIAAAVPTAGASMSWIPIARLIAQKAIEFAINLGIEKLLG